MVATRILVFVLENPPPNIWPKLRDCIFSHQTNKSPKGANQSRSRVRFAVGPPGIGDKVISRSGDGTGISPHETAVSIVREKSHRYHISHSAAQRKPLRGEISRVFARQSPPSRFHRVTRRHPGESHPVSFCKPFK